jgi:hypothetical protein
MVSATPRRHAAGPRARSRRYRPRSSSGRRPVPRPVRARRRGAHAVRRRSRATSLAARLQRPTGRRNASTRLLVGPSAPGRSGTDVENVGRAWLSARSREQIAGSRRPPLNRRTALPSLRGETFSQATARHLAGRCPARSRFAGAVKWPCRPVYPFPGPRRTLSRSCSSRHATTGRHRVHPTPLPPQRVASAGAESLPAWMPARAADAQPRTRQGDRG